ncbi:MAG: 2-dehydropantoate 2-reductase [Desulfobulbaceae bacterium]|nr:2-dehydropantoate 2-reductase [Desulfobulbaceae bacterium]
MRIAIVGPGALGLFLAGRLSRLIAKKSVSGEKEQSDSVCLLDYNKERAAELREKGIWLEQSQWSGRVWLEVSAEPKSLGIFDIVFLCVKVPAVEAALEHFSVLVGPDTLVVGMQNGIKHPELIANAGGIAALGVTSEGVTLLAPGRVAHRGRGLTRLGLLGKESSRSVKRLNELAVMLNGADLITEVVDSVVHYLWAKLLVNVGINALTAIHDIPNGELLKSEHLTRKMELAVREATRVAFAYSVPVVGDPVADVVAVCRSTADNISSMLQDVRKSRFTEIDAINGAIVQAGKKLSIPTPVNDELTASVKALEKSYHT